MVMKEPERAVNFSTLAVSSPTFLLSRMTLRVEAQAGLTDLITSLMLLRTELCLLVGVRLGRDLMTSPVYSWMLLLLNGPGILS